MKKTLKFSSGLDASFKSLIFGVFFHFHHTHILSFCCPPPHKSLCVVYFSYKRTSETLSQASLKATAAFSNMGSVITRKLEDVRWVGGGGQHDNLRVKQSPKTPGKTLECIVLHLLEFVSWWGQRGEFHACKNNQGHVRRPHAVCSTYSNFINLLWSAWLFLNRPPKCSSCEAAVACAWIFPISFQVYLILHVGSLYVLTCDLRISADLRSEGVLWLETCHCCARVRSRPWFCSVFYVMMT